MSKRFSVFGILLALVAAVPVTAPAIAAGAGGEARAANAHKPDLYRSSKIIGSTVRNAQERKVGVIKDLMLDSRRGEIAYAVIRFGGVMGTGETYHAVPWTALAPGDDGRFYILRADKETIERAPGFDKRNWPEMGDPGWSAEVDRYWSRLVGTGAPAQGQLVVPGVSGSDGSGSGR